MRVALLTVVFTALSLVAPTAVSELARAAGLTGLSQSLADVDAAHAAFIRRGKIKKRATVGYRVVVVVGDDTSSSASDIAAVAVDFLDSSGPAPSDSKLTLPLVSIDGETGDRTYAANLDFEDDAVGTDQAVLFELRDDAGEAVGTDQALLTVSAAAMATPELEVLNVPNDAGDIVVVTGDVAEVSFTKTCDEPEDPAECTAQRALADQARIRLVTSDGKVQASKKIGKRRQAGSVSLKTKGATFGVSSIQIAVRSKTTGSWDVFNEVPLTLVSNSTEAALLERVGVLEQTVETQDAQLSLNKERIAEIVDLVEELAAKSAVNVDDTANNTAAVASLEEQLAAASDGIATNAAAIAEHGITLIKHFQLISDETIKLQVTTETADANTAALAKLDERVTANEDADAGTSVLAQQTWDVFRARTSGSGEAFGTDGLESSGAFVSLEIGSTTATVDLDLPAELREKVADDAVITATFRLVDGNEFTIPEKVVMEKDGDFYGAIVPVDSTGGLSDVAGIYRADFEVPLADGSVAGPFTAFVLAGLQQGEEALSATATFDEKSSSVALTIEVSTDGTIDPEDTLVFQMVPHGDASPTKEASYTMTFTGETPKTWVFGTSGITFESADKAKGGTYDLVFDESYVRTISVDI